MKISTKQLLEVQSGLKKINTLAEDEKTRDRVSFNDKHQTMRAIKLTKPEIETYAESRQDLLKELGTLSDKKAANGDDQYELGDNVEKFNDMIKELEEKEISINLTNDMFKLSEFKKTKIPISPMDMLSLEIITLQDLDKDGNVIKEKEKKKAESKKK